MNSRLYSWLCLVNFLGTLLMYRMITFTIRNLYLHMIIPSACPLPSLQKLCFHFFPSLPSPMHLPLFPFPSEHVLPTSRCPSHILVLIYAFDFTCTKNNAIVKYVSPSFHLQEWPQCESIYLKLSQADPSYGREYSILYNNHIFCIDLSINGHLGCFQDLVIMSMHILLWHDASNFHESANKGNS